MRSESFRITTKTQKNNFLVDSIKAAKQIGSQKKAAIVIWGDHQENINTVLISVNFEFLKKQDNFPVGNSFALNESYEKALESYDQAIKIQPDLAKAWYNKAASYAPQNQIDLALQNMEQAFKLPNTNLKEYIKTDTDFDGIRSNRRFQNLVTSKHSETK